MSPRQIVISGKQLLKILEKMGFILVKIRGSHHILKHMDGRKTTVPVHRNDDLPSGLLRKIVKEDLQITFEEFEKLVKE